MTVNKIPLFRALVVIAAALIFGEAQAGGDRYSVVSSGYYQLLNRFEPLVATDRNIDLWAQIYRPAQVYRGPFPLVVFLHGNHGTCGYFDATLKVRVDDRSDYTTTGQCPPGYVVTPNHLGYAYMAEKLASYGYIVVSINANRGITAGQGIVGDRGLNLMRGRLVLRHLALLSDWNRGSGSISPPSSLGFSPVGSMDFSQVGFFGHSRGGEGVRAALQQFRDAGSPFPALIGPLSVKSIFEIGPVDGQTSRVLDANGVHSNILLPACDGDVSNLQGIHVLDRVFLNTSPDPVQDFHSTTKVWGADHNAYNSEWLTADSPGCDGTPPLFPQAGRSVPQQVTAREQLVPFFRATVGPKADLSLAALFDPINPVPSEITDIAKVDRGYLPAPLGANSMLVENFAGVTGSSSAAGVSVVQQAASFEHYVGTRVATVSWTPSSPPIRYFQVDFGSGKDVSAYKFFSLRTALRCFGSICSRKASDFGELAYQVSLVDSYGRVSNPVSTLGRTRLSRPIGDEASNLHSDLYTVQIPTWLYFGVDKTHIKGVRFSFPLYKEGTVDLTDLTFLRKDPLADFSPVVDISDIALAAIKAVFAQAGSVVASPAAAAEGNTVRLMAHATSDQKVTANASASVPMVDIVLTSKRAFMIGNALPKVQIGKVTIEDGYISPDGKTLTVSVPAAMMGQLPAGAPVSVVLQKSLPAWQFGSLQK